MIGAADDAALWTGKLTLPAARDCFRLEQNSTFECGMARSMMPGIPGSAVNDTDSALTVVVLFASSFSLA